MRIIHIPFGKGGKLEGRENYKIPKTKSFIVLCFLPDYNMACLCFVRCGGLKGLVKINLCNF